MGDLKRLFVLDGTALLYRAHYAMINNPLVTSTGFITSGIFGFMNALVRLLRKESPDYLAAVFDDRAKTFRHQLYTEYKATREKMPDELAAQLEPLEEILTALRVPVLRVPGFEADDIMGTLARRAETLGWRTYLVTGDKDMMQLVSEHTLVYVPAQRRNPVKVYGRAEVEERWGVPPEKMVDLMGLMGDSSDNIPGVAGVGAKTALKLVMKYGGLEEALNHAAEVGNKRAREGLQTGRELALLSKELVTIDCQVPLDLDMETLNIGGLDPVAGGRKLQEYEIRAITDDLLALGGEAPATPVERPQKHYEMVTTAQELDSLCSQLSAAPWFSFDLETTSLNPLQAEIVGLAFAIEPHHGWYVPVRFPEKGTVPSLELEQVLAAVGPILEDPQCPIIGQNIKYDLQVMARYDIDVNGIIFDTMIGAHLLEPDTASYKLDNLSLKYLNYELVPIEELIGKKGKGQLSMAEVPLQRVADYAAEDADITALLYPLLSERLQELHLDQTNAQLEVPLIPVLAEMERNGVFLDLELLAEMSRQLNADLKVLVQRIHETAGTEFNINSPQQLGVVLFDQLQLPQVRKRSTDVNVLQILRPKHPLPGLILDYRLIKKLQSTYIDAFPALVLPETGRVHSSFNQTVAATGRLSSSHPNFQNIPIRTELGREIRKAFRAQGPGWGIFSADYSQIELRVMAHLAGETALIEAFRADRDIHALTASIVFGVPAEEVTADQRRTAKVVNFGIMYGAGPFRMAQELDITLQEGRELINRYFNTSPGIRLFVDRLLHQAREDGYVATLLGRRRNVPGLQSKNQRLRSADERMAVNAPIQGTAAELIKIAMIKIHHRLKADGFRAKMILQVHDELLFETPDEEFERLRAMVVREMETALELSVPLKVDTGYGPTWYEAH